MPIFKGAGVAIVTPMKDNFEVDYERLEENINYQIDNGTDCIVIAGTTGEGSTLTEREHLDVIKAAVDFTKHRIPVIAGTGSNCTRTAIEMSKEADSYGVEGILVVTPYYNRATQNGLISHYTQIANAVKTKVVMYNVPSRTGCNLIFIFSVPTSPFLLGQRTCISLTLSNSSSLMCLHFLQHPLYGQM